nr:hypothetical protein [uncultured Rhodoblastus sp.]
MGRILASHCPAAAIVNIGFLDPGALLFMGAMLAGMKRGEVFSVPGPRRSRVAPSPLHDRT